MPVSHHEGKDWLYRRYEQIRPESVVDVGAGEGIYAMRFRALHRAHWSGVEVWEPYVSQFGLDGKYDDVIIGDARTLDLPDADLYIAGDVLEHMPKPDALALITRMQVATQHLFVSIPIAHIEQGPRERQPARTAPPPLVLH